MSRTRAFTALLSAQWRQQQLELGALTVGAAVVPPLALWPTLDSDGWMTGSLVPNVSLAIGGLGALLAVIVGVLVAVRPYSLDATTRHTYALSLPIPRPEYALLRVATGLVLLFVPTAGFLTGALIASAAVTLPEAYHAYPLGLGARYLLASMFAFAIAFSLQYGLGRRAARVILTGVMVLAVLEIVSQILLGDSISTPIWEALSGEFSPLRVFASEWKLFDV